MSDNVVKFTPRKETPDADCIWTDEHGVEWFKFTCEYQYEGSRWGFEVWARSFEDAQARLGSIGCTGIVNGQLFAQIAADSDVTVDAIVRAGGVMAEDPHCPDKAGDE